MKVHVEINWCMFVKKELQLSDFFARLYFFKFAKFDELQAIISKQIELSCDYENRNCTANRYRHHKLQ